MGDKFSVSVKTLEPYEQKAIAWALYILAKDIERFGSNEEMQTLYNVLVETMNLRSHAEKVLTAVIKQHIKNGYLHHLKKGDIKRNHYDSKENPKVFFKEDRDLYDGCGNFNTGNEFNINTVRAIFAPPKRDFATVIAYTFFVPEQENRKTFTIPESFDVSDEIRNSFLNCKKVEFFAEAFELTREEKGAVAFAYYARIIRELSSILENLISGEFESKNSIYEKVLNLSGREVEQLFQQNKKLRTYGIFSEDNCIESDVIESIYAGDLNSFFADILKGDTGKEIYDISSFSVQKTDVELALRLLKSSSATNILLYGAPGAGKTEFARSLAKLSGLETMFFKNELEIEGNKSSNFALARMNCLLSLHKDDTVIIVDEAESILNTNISSFEMMFGGGRGNVRKGTVNKMLENSTNKVIWIMNYTDTLDESTLRRFTYSISFREMSKSMLRNIADSKLDKVNISGGLHKELVDLCGKYHVTGASVDNMVKTISGMGLSAEMGLESEERVVKDVQKVLEANSQLLYGKTKMRDKVNDSYDLSILNTSTPASEIVEMVKNALSFAEENPECKNGIRMLFYGLSGTGKTELARYIAEVLNKRILLKRASDIFGPYVGQEEAAIKKAFEQAEASGDILLFDEADSFFADRTATSQPWMRTMVNEFLTQMEEFSGILICTTNLRQIMDPAMQRRFHILAEFNPLKKEGIETLLGKFFRNYSFTSKQIEDISGWDTVTPGDFGALAGKIRFMPKEKINSQMIIDELGKIQLEKENNGSKRIGFAV